MYYKEKQDLVPDKDGNFLWRPDIVRTGKTITTKTLSKLISNATTLTQPDITAALQSLPIFMNMYLKEGNTIHLDGLGTFKVYGRSKGKGVLNKKDVRPSQFGSLVIKFIPEYKVAVGGGRTRALLDEVEFTHISRLAKGYVGDADEDEDLPGGNDDSGNSGGGDEFIDPSA